MEQSVLPENYFLKDVQALKAATRGLLAREPGAVSERQDTIALLQSVLAAEIVCVLRYTMISISQDGLRNEAIGAEFQEQANDERKHMKMAAARIVELGGKPNFNPEHLASRVAALSDCDGNFAQRVRENLAAEQSVIAHYHTLIEHFSGRDPQTCAMLQEIVRDEEDHTRDMEDLIASCA
ncbi:MAG: hypothetical protein B7Z80_05785 [Rhodospirillales bacterium 20-64-7]|nr:MAG: hypothetical protein B7Z80_05785 [Rhodospirillales bacterium 20-64-7]